jgi:hypothetical protein
MGPLEMCELFPIRIKASCLQDDIKNVCEVRNYRGMSKRGDESSYKMSSQDVAPAVHRRPQSRAAPCEWFRNQEFLIFPFAVSGSCLRTH